VIETEVALKYSSPRYREETDSSLALEYFYTFESERKEFLPFIITNSNYNLR